MLFSLGWTLMLTLAAILVDEMGEMVGPAVVWTGFHPNQDPQLDHCLAWTSESIDEFGFSGFTQNAGVLATSGTRGRCNTGSQRVYCFED